MMRIGTGIRDGAALPSVRPAIPMEHWWAVCAALRLSPREAQIARGLLDGGTQSMVAAALSMSPHTVHEHIRRLYRKLRVSSRTEFSCAVFSAYVRCVLGEISTSADKGKPAHG